jgi:hypothetical protein
MFCPKCGAVLLLKPSESAGEELYCAKGKMGLAPLIQRAFEERYGSNAVLQSPNPPFHSQFHGGLHWFCPGDGERLNARLECSTCGKHLRDLVYQLVEFHPHERSKNVSSC